VRRAGAIGFSLATLVVSALTARHYADAGWPLAGANLWLAAIAGILFFGAFVLKGAGWRRLFAHHERPGSHALAAANAAASVTGVALPGRFDDVVRLAVARRFRSRAGIGAIVLSLVIVGFVDSAAIVPIASAAAGLASVSDGMRAALILVAAAGVAAAVVVLALPRLARSPRVNGFRAGRWLARHATCRREASRAWLLVTASWAMRALALYVLLGALGIGHSFALALLFLTASAASAALPLGPAGAATQAGAGAAVLVLAGVTTHEAVSFALAAQILVVLAGAAVVVGATVWEARLRLVARTA
jgi:uncharacterized membrane protein YbhN (UPF0104 family)